MAGLVLDVIIIGIVALCVFFSARKGFVYGLVEIVGIAVAIIMIVNFTEPVSNAVFEHYIEPSMISSAEKTVNNNAEVTSEKIWNSFPDIITNNAEKFGVSKTNVTAEITKSAQSGINNAFKTASNMLVKPVIIRLLSSFITVVALIILIALVRILAKFLNGFFKISILGKLNRFLGGTFGFFKGIILAMLFCVIVGLLASVINGLFIFTDSAIEASHLFKYIYNFIPFT